MEDSRACKEYLKSKKKQSSLASTRVCRVTRRHQKLVRAKQCMEDSRACEEFTEQVEEVASTFSLHKSLQSYASPPESNRCKAKAWMIAGLAKSSPSKLKK